MNADAIIGDAIYEILHADSAVSALIGDRVFPVIAKLNSIPPFLVYSERLSEPIITKEGPIQRDLILLEITAISKSYREAKTISNKVRQALTITFAPGVYAGVDIARIAFETVLTTEYEEQNQYYMDSNRYRVRVN